MEACAGHDDWPDHQCAYQAELRVKEKESSYYDTRSQNQTVEEKRTEMVVDSGRGNGGGRMSQHV